MHAWAHKMNKLCLADELESAHSIVQALVQPEEQLPNKMPAWAYMNTLHLADALELACQQPTTSYAQAFTWAHCKYYNMAHETITWALQLLNEMFAWAHIKATVGLGSLL